MTISVPVTQRTLANGLTVLVHEDHLSPLVAVCVWYHVGSKNERRGKTGYAHLFEHLMFEGALHQPRGYFEPLQAVGGSLNGSTSADRTNYWELVPREAAALALWMEADRMGFLLPALTAERFNTQRDVVLNERRQNYENRPYGLAQFVLSDALFDRPHPYSWPTIGEPDDLHAATPDDAREFFATYYHPGNASLTIAGDIETAEALEMAERYFGGIARGPDVMPVEAAAPSPRARRIVIEDRVELPRLYLAWPSPCLFTDEDAELDLAGDALANGRTSRLYGRLIHAQRLAAELGAQQVSRELAGMFQVAVTAAPDHTLTELHREVAEVVQDIATDGLTDDELSRSRAQAEAAFALRLQTLGGFGGKADQLNAYQVYRGEPDGFQADLDRYLRVTPAGAGAAVARWLDPAEALALSVVPHGRRDLALVDSVPADEVVP